MKGGAALISHRSPALSQEYVDLPSPLPPEDLSLSLRVTGPFTICLHQYNSNKCFGSTYKFQGLSAQRRRPA